jgi:hypothetical protein
MADSDFDDGYEFDDYIQGISNTLTIGLDLLLFPSCIYLVTMHLIRQANAEKRQKKK